MCTVKLFIQTKHIYHEQASAVTQLITRSAVYISATHCLSFRTFIHYFNSNKFPFKQNWFISQEIGMRLICTFRWSSSLFFFSCSCRLRACSCQISTAEMLPWLTLYAVLTALILPILLLLFNCHYITVSMFPLFAILVVTAAMSPLPASSSHCSRLVIIKLLLLLFLSSPYFHLLEVFNKETNFNK